MPGENEDWVERTKELIRRHPPRLLALPEMEPPPMAWLYPLPPWPPDSELTPFERAMRDEMEKRHVG